MTAPAKRIIYIMISFVLVLLTFIPTRNENTFIVLLIFSFYFLLIGLLYPFKDHYND